MSFGGRFLGSVSGVVCCFPSFFVVCHWIDRCLCYIAGPSLAITLQPTEDGTKNGYHQAWNGVW